MLLPVCAIKIRLCMTRPTKGDQVQRIAILLIVVNMVNVLTARTWHHLVLAHLAGVLVSLPNAGFESFAKLIRPGLSAIAVNIAGAFLAFPFFRPFLPSFIRPVSAHFAACFGLVLFAFIPNVRSAAELFTQFLIVFFGALIGRSTFAKSFVAIITPLYFSIYWSLAIDTDPFFSTFGNLPEQAFFTAYSIPVFGELDAAIGAKSFGYCNSLFVAIPAAILTITNYNAAIYTDMIFGGLKAISARLSAILNFFVAAWAKLSSHLSSDCDIKPYYTTI